MRGFVRRFWERKGRRKGQILLRAAPYERPSDDVPCRDRLILKAERQPLTTKANAPPIESIPTSTTDGVLVETNV